MRRSRRAVAAVGGALAIALTAGAFALAPAAGAAPAAAHPAPPLSRIHPSHPMHAVHGRPAPSTVITNTLQHASSSNWAGYVAYRNRVTFRYVSATFYVPYLDCSGVTAQNPTYASHWVGLDGFISGTVEQTGILSACVADSSGNVVPSYRAWYEMAPNKPGYPAGMTLHPGDQITASVYYNKSGNNYRMMLADNNAREQFTVWRGCPSGHSCTRSSAEAISESPATIDSSGNLAYLPLADFQAASFARIQLTNTSGDRGGMQTNWWDYYQINQLSNGTNPDAAGNPIPANTPLDNATRVTSGTSFANYYQPGT